MRVETEKKGVYRELHSKGLVIPKNEAYQKYLKEKDMKKRMVNLENNVSELDQKLSQILNILEGKK